MGRRQTRRSTRLGTNLQVLKSKVRWSDPMVAARVVPRSSVGLRRGIISTVAAALLGQLVLRWAS